MDPGKILIVATLTVGGRVFGVRTAAFRELPSRERPSRMPPGSGTSCGTTLVNGAEQRRLTYSAGTPGVSRIRWRASVSAARSTQ